MTGDVFGDSLLMSESGPNPHGQTDHVHAEDGPAPILGWTGHLQGVDEQLMLKVWRRLLADAEATNAMLQDGFLRGLHDAVQKPLVVSGDINTTLIARILTESSDGNRAIPFLDSSAQDGQLLRIAGEVSSVRATPNGWAIRLRRPKGASCLVRFSKEAFLQDRPTRLQEMEVVVLAIGQGSQRLEFAGIALLIQIPT